MSLRRIATTWTDYTACINKKIYKFRVIVELDGNNPEEITHIGVVELLEMTSDMWRNLIQEQADEDEDQD